MGRLGAFTAPEGDDAAVGRAFLSALMDEPERFAALRRAALVSALVRRAEAGGTVLPPERRREIAQAVRSLTGDDPPPVVPADEELDLEAGPAVPAAEIAMRAEELVDDPELWGALVRARPEAPLAYFARVLAWRLSDKMGRSRKRAGARPARGEAARTAESQHRIEQLLRAIRGAAERAAAAGSPDADELVRIHADTLDTLLAHVEAHSDKARRLVFVLRKLFGEEVWPDNGTVLHAWTREAASGAWSGRFPPWARAWAFLAAGRRIASPAEAWPEGYDRLAAAMEEGDYLSIDESVVLAAGVAAPEPGEQLDATVANTWGKGVTRLNKAVQPLVEQQARAVLRVLADRHREEPDPLVLAREVR